jgi:hypothetical protein
MCVKVFVFVLVLVYGRTTLRIPMNSMFLKENTKRAEAP